MIDEKWKRPKEERIRKRIREGCRWKEKRLARMINEKWKRPKGERIRKRIREGCRWKEKRLLEW